MWLYARDSCNLFGTKCIFRQPSSESYRALSVTAPITNRIRLVQSAWIVLFFVVGIVIAPLALIPQVEHSHPLDLDGQQLADRHTHGGPRLDDWRSHHHHDHTHHHHDHSHHHHAKTESTGVDYELGSSRATTKSEVSPSSRHHHFNLFGLSFAIHFDGRSSDATGIEENRSVDFGLLVAQVCASVLRCHPWLSPSIRL